MNRKDGDERKRDREADRGTVTQKGKKKKGGEIGRHGVSQTNRKKDGSIDR